MAEVELVINVIGYSNGNVRKVLINGDDRGRIVYTYGGYKYW